MPNANVYMCDQVRAVIELHRDLLAAHCRQQTIGDQLDQQAQRLLEAHSDGNTAAVTHITCWHPEYVGCSARHILDCDFTLQDARETMAREYGFDDWSDVTQRGTSPPCQAFEEALDALLCGNVTELNQRLKDHPQLTAQRSRFGHESTLLHYCGSNGVETHRQVVPSNLAVITQTLIDAGADVNATANMYGGGSTTISLLITSSHPAEAGVTDEVVKVLVDAGADTE